MDKAGIARDMLESVGERRCVGHCLAEHTVPARTSKKRELCTDPMTTAKIGECAP